MNILIHKRLYRKEFSHEYWSHQIRKYGSWIIKNLINHGYDTFRFGTKNLGFFLFTAAAAMQLFQVGKTKHPGGDNYAVTLLTEKIVGASLKND